MRDGGGGPGGRAGDPALSEPGGHPARSSLGSKRLRDPRFLPGAAWRSRVRTRPGVRQPAPCGLGVFGERWWGVPLSRAPSHRGRGRRRGCAGARAECRKVTRCLRSWEIGADAGRLDAGGERWREPRDDSLVLASGPGSAVRPRLASAPSPSPLARGTGEGGASLSAG